MSGMNYKARVTAVMLGLEGSEQPLEDVFPEAGRGLSAPSQRLSRGGPQILGSEHISDVCRPYDRLS